MLNTNIGIKLSIQQRVFRNISIHLAIFRLACARAAMRCLSAAPSLLRTYCAVLIQDGTRSRTVRVRERRTVPTLGTLTTPMAPNFCAGAYPWGKTAKALPTRGEVWPSVLRAYKTPIFAKP